MKCLLPGKTSVEKWNKTQISHDIRTGFVSDCGRVFPNYWILLVWKMVRFLNYSCARIISISRWAFFFCSFRCNACINRWIEQNTFGVCVYISNDSHSGVLYTSDMTLSPLPPSLLTHSVCVCVSMFLFLTLLSKANNRKWIGLRSTTILIRLHWKCVVAVRRRWWWCITFSNSFPIQTHDIKSHLITIYDLRGLFFAPRFIMPSQYPKS